MKKTNLLKLFLTLLLIGSLILGMSSISVYAANEDEENVIDYGNLLDDDDGDGDNEAANNEAGNTNNGLVDDTNTNTNNNTNNNASIYNTNNTNTNLPATGITDAVPVAMLIVIAIISALYAYKKINDYKNI